MTPPATNFHSSPSSSLHGHLTTDLPEAKDLEDVLLQSQALIAPGQKPAVPTGHLQKLSPKGSGLTHFQPTPQRNVKASEGVDQNPAAASLQAWDFRSRNPAWLTGWLGNWLKPKNNLRPTGRGSAYHLKCSTALTFPPIRTEPYQATSNIKQYLHHLLIIRRNHVNLAYFCRLDPLCSL